ncbi:MAG: hypothetical protein AAF945_15720 [Actinomycetota bacterium]
MSRGSFKRLLVSIRRWLPTPAGALFLVAVVVAVAAVVFGGTALGVAAVLTSASLVAALFASAARSRQAVEVELRRTRQQLTRLKGDAQRLRDAVGTPSPDLPGRPSAVRRLEQAEADSARLERELSSVRTSMQTQSNATKGEFGAVSSRLDRLAEARREDRQSTRDDFRAHEALVERRSATLRSEIDRQMSRSLRMVIGQLDDGTVPDRLLLLVTIHRSGSTRLIDVIRTHPSVRLHPTAELWDRLGFEGRRYPVAFSDLPGPADLVEVDRDQVAAVPRLPTFDYAGRSSIRWGVEKTHPQFADFDADAMVDGIRRLEGDGVGVDVVFGVRRPLDAMWSMHEFKTRQPSWYARLETAAIPSWIERSLRVIRDVQTELGGLVVDHADLPDGASLRSIASIVDPGMSSDDVTSWLSAAAGWTAPETRRQAPDSGFLGSPSEERVRNGPSGAWEGVADVITEAESHYLGITSASRG